MRKNFFIVFGCAQWMLAVENKKTEGYNRGTQHCCTMKESLKGAINVESRLQHTD